MSETSKPHSELRELLAVAIEDVLLIDSPEGDSPRNIAANLREVLAGLDGLFEQLGAAQRERDEAREVAQDAIDNWIRPALAALEASVQGAPSPVNGDAETSGTSGRPAPFPASERAS